jgi:IclR family KDG regulon transcriptional repressor
MINKYFYIWYCQTLFRITEHMKKESGIQSVSRAFGILSLFTHSTPSLGITEISRSLNLPKGTVHGLTRTLLKAGFLQQDPATKKYHLGLKIYELGVILAATLEINVKAEGPAQQLTKRTHLVSRIAIWDGNSALITLNVDPRSYASFVHQIGPRIPAYCSAVGKVLLAFLEEQELDAYLDQTELVPYTSKTITERERLVKELEKTRQRGYSTDQEETLLGLACIGAPLFGRGGRCEASISLSGDPDLIYGKQRKGLVEGLLRTAGEISRSTGSFPETVLKERVIKNVR